MDVHQPHSSAALDQEGWVRVPRGMTEEMLLAGCTAVQDIYAKEGGWCGLKAAQDQVAATWNAMLAAALNQTGAGDPK